MQSNMSICACDVAVAICFAVGEYRASVIVFDVCSADVVCVGWGGVWGSSQCVSYGERRGGDEGTLKGDVHCGM